MGIWEVGETVELSKSIDCKDKKGGIMNRPIFVTMKLGPTCVGMINKFVSPKEVIVCGKKFQEKKRRSMEKESKEE